VHPEPGLYFSEHVNGRGRIQKREDMKTLRLMLSRRFPALPVADLPLGELPFITRQTQTLSYALSLVISSVCYTFKPT
jgi:hypothetical protein